MYAGKFVAVLLALAFYASVAALLLVVAGGCAVLENTTAVAPIFSDVYYGCEPPSELKPRGTDN